MRTSTAILSVLAFASLSAVTGCSSVRPSSGPAVAGFTPYRAVRSEQATESALKLDHGDKPLLSKAGAHYVGELEIEGQDRAASEAARAGATHYLAVAPSRYALFRVDPNRWNELPAELRPATAGEPTSTTMLTSAPLR